MRFPRNVSLIIATALLLHQSSVNATAGTITDIITLDETTHSSANIPASATSGALQLTEAQRVTRLEISDLVVFLNGLATMHSDNGDGGTGTDDGILTSLLRPLLQVREPADGIYDYTPNDNTNPGYYSTVDSQHMTHRPEYHIVSDPNETVPEPSTLTLLAIGIVGIAGHVRRRRRS